MRPELLTFDVFGTIIDWRAGLSADLAAYGHPLQEGEYDRIVDFQDAAESGPFRTYQEITVGSLVQVAGLSSETAHSIANNIGRWPLFPDARDAFRKLLRIAPCVAMTNSDRVHGTQIQEQLGFQLTDWVCAEEVRAYKPSIVFWKAVAARRGMAPGKTWWHVSAYADYDLQTANSLGLTTVFVARPHSRPGPADHAVSDLGVLAGKLEKGEL